MKITDFAHNRWQTAPKFTQNIGEQCIQIEEHSLVKNCRKMSMLKNSILEIFAADGQNFDMGSWTRTGTIKLSKRVTGMKLKQGPKMDDNASRKTQRIA